MLLVSQMGIAALPTRKAITVASGVNAKCTVHVKKTSATFSEKVANLDFLAGEGVSDNVLIGLSDLERLKDRISVAS